MKTYLFLLIILTSTNALFAQGPGPNRFERIKAHKIAYITNQVGLSPEEAENFWPLYNQYEMQLHQLKVVDRKELLSGITNNGGLENLSEEEAQIITQNIDKLKTNIYQTENEKYNKLQKVLSAKKLLKLYKAEQDFKKELLNRLREKRGKRFR